MSAARRCGGYAPADKRTPIGGPLVRLRLKPYNALMKREFAITALQAHAPELRRMGAMALYLFGSVARGEPEARDLDLFIDYNPDKPISLFDLVGMKQLLEEELHTDVDITTRDSLHPMLKADIEQSAIRVF
jgi:predicted nucleotidyltransferase